MIGKETISRFSSHFLARQEDKSHTCLEGLDDWVKDIFDYGQPMLDDEPVSLYLDCNDDETKIPIMSPTPRLELGTGCRIVTIFCQNQITPCCIIASATLRKPATFAPNT